MKLTVPVQERLRVDTLRTILKWSALTGVGRTISCENCGRELFKGIPVVWRGRLRLLGSAAALVRVDWDGKNSLAFRHVEQEVCKAGSR